MDEVAAGVLGVGVDVETHTAAHTGALQPSQNPSQGISILGRVDLRQLLEQRCQATSLDGLLVEETCVQLTDTLLVGRARHGD